MKTSCIRYSLKSQSSGFTLTEILVVVSIIALLSSILLPVFSIVREKGRQTSCQTNIKQIQLAVQLYTQDFNGIYPSYFNELLPKYPGNPNYSPGKGWAVRLSAYIKDNAILQCPSESTLGSTDPKLPYGKPAGTPGYTDYAYNFFLSDMPDSKFAYPDRTVSFTDGPPMPAWSLAGDPTGKLSQFDRHSGGGNCAFADGHVKWFKPEKIFAIGGLNSTICAADSSAATFCVY